MTADEQTLIDLEKELSEQLPRIAKELQVNEQSLRKQIDSITQKVAEKRKIERNEFLQEEATAKEVQKKAKKSTFPFDELE